ncbi:MAG: ATP-dependent DNA helicase [Coraliomargaritaceae bacterium]
MTKSANFLSIGTMRIDSENATVHLSVSELATFRRVPAPASLSSGPWRAALGQSWHEEARKQASATQPEARFEVPVDAVWRHRRWTFHLTGRIDQILPCGDGWLLREVKTVRTPLPVDKADLLQNHPGHFAQAAAYLALLRLQTEYSEQPLRAQLQYIHIDDGTVQNIDLDDSDASLFEAQLDTLFPYLEDRRSAARRLDNLEIRPAFASLRPGQAELFARLEAASTESKNILLQAPTGFGKTGIALQHALEKMRSGHFQRCIYLTSKSTGQWQAIRQIQAMTGNDLRHIQMRNRAEHRIDTPAHTCTADSRCDLDSEPIWQDSGIHPPELFTEGSFPIESARHIGTKTGLCPYALTRACLPFAEIWIADSNYLFAPAVRSVFESATGFHPATTLLIIDEAHNLPARAADALGAELADGELLFAMDALAEAGASRRLLSIGRELSHRLTSIEKTGPLETNTRYVLLDLCEDFHRCLQQERLNYRAAQPFALDLAWQIAETAQHLAEAEEKYLHWSPSKGVLRSTCLDASRWIEQCMEGFGSVLLMSATLDPIPAFAQSCGLANAQTATAIGHADWRDAAYNVAIDCRVDTRFKQRQHHYETTAATIAALIAHSPGQPIAVFFAAYQYAEAVKNYLEALEPAFRAALQKRGADLHEQSEFIEHSLLSADALFLILGSSYAEGIDQLGGRIQTAMVVGPALPEVNAIQDARMDAHTGATREEAFRDCYILPAMRRIHQALGRLVRAPGQHARILLHGKRFAEPAYSTQLASEYQSDRYIHKQEDLLHWLEERRNEEEEVAE